MQIKKLLFCFTLLAFVLSFKLTAQNNSQNDELLKSNAIYGSVGWAGLYVSATGFYERIIKQQMWSKPISSFVKVGFGAEAHWLGNGTYALAQYGFLVGRKAHHLEMGVGPSYFIPGDFSGFFPSATVGWRVQKPGGHFIYRMGVSIPEAIYLGFGVAF